MTDTILELVKARLGRRDDLLDDYLAARIDAAVEELAASGIHIQNNPRDCMFVCDYVVWQYGNRDKGAPGQDTKMPEWLRLARRERFLQEGGR